MPFDTAIYQFGLKITSLRERILIGTQVSSETHTTPQHFRLSLHTEKCQNLQLWDMGVIPGGLEGLQLPHFEVGVANASQPPEF